jgi:hypothetical protein
MKKLSYSLTFGLLLAIMPMAATAQDEELSTEASVWVGGNYTGMNDYTRKAGEYYLGDETSSPEFKLNYIGRGTDNTFYLFGHYQDENNTSGFARATVNNRFSFTAQYRSLIHWKGQDLLENLSAREWLGTNPGGKILTHEITDPAAEYNTHRQEILTKFSALLSEKNNVRLTGAHRTILQTGTEQGLSNSHCFSCHIVSATVPVDNRTHAITAELQADPVDNMTVGYEFGYRMFKSDESAPIATYDEAKHPVHGGAGAEFGSRLLFDNTTVPYSVLPEVEKVSNKVRMKANLNATTRLATSVGYNRTTNKNTELQSKAWSGSASLATRLGNDTRLILKGSGVSVRTDDLFIMLPLYRAGRPGPQPDFSYTRY